MKIHEYQAKEIFRKHGIPTPKGVAIRSAHEASSVFEKQAFKEAVIKAQVLAGARGKGGGIVRVKSAREAKEAAARLIGSRLTTQQSGIKSPIITSILLEEAEPFDKEFYMGLAINRSEGVVNLIFSDEGGVEIEEIAKRTPHKIHRLPLQGTADKTSLSRFFSQLQLSAEFKSLRSNLSDIAQRLVRIFADYDCELVEINPLAVQPEALVALDAKIVFDDNALFRHPELKNLKDPDEDDEKEKKAKRSGLSYVSMGGNIGCLVNGAGLAMATMDIIKQAGGEPANFLDVGGGADKEQVLEGLRIILEDTHVKAILVNIFGGITQCDVIAQALLEAAQEIGIPVPVIIRLEGTRVEEARQILTKTSIKSYTAATMDEAAEMAARLARHPKHPNPLDEHGDPH